MSTGHGASFGGKPGELQSRPLGSSRMSARATLPTIALASEALGPMPHLWVAGAGAQAPRAPQHRRPPRRADAPARARLRARPRRPPRRSAARPRPAARRCARRPPRRARPRPPAPPPARAPAESPALPQPAWAARRCGPSPELACTLPDSERLCGIRRRGQTPVEQVCGRRGRSRSCMATCTPAMCLSESASVSPLPASLPVQNR